MREAIVRMALVQGHTIAVMMYRKSDTNASRGHMQAIRDDSIDVNALILC